MRKIPIEMKLPIYPIPPGETEPRTYQTAGEVKLYTILELDDGFKTADEFIVMGNMDAKILNAYVKGFKEMLESDKEAMKHYLVGERDVKVTSYNTQNSTEPPSHGTSDQPSWSPPSNDQSPVELTEAQLKFINALTNPSSYLYREKDPMAVSMAVSKRNEKLANCLRDFNLNSHAQLSKRQASDLIQILKSVEV